MWEKKPSLTDFGTLFLPKEADEPILAKPVRDALLNWLTEIFAEDELKQVGISARKRAIFDGLPGVGKTTLAHHLSARLGLPMLAVRPERIIDKWVGSSGRNIGDLFDLVTEEFSLDGSGENKVPVVLFLDEFDALAAGRSDVQQGADQARNEMVNTLLQRIEQYDGFLIAATNFAKRIDEAIWRRFDMHITLELPGQFEREEIIKRYLKPFGLPKTTLQLFGEVMRTASPALIRAICEGLKREIIIGPKLGSNMDKEAVFARLVSSIQPHPDAGKPPLWSNKNSNRDFKLLLEKISWPLLLLGDVKEIAEIEIISTNNIIPIGGKLNDPK